ncbi:methyltransferase domain-containing protein [Fragilaria crotonensis]|nr:methyltransferase domain-containing protein [Fragilaria crotonensis]KAI2510299.1 methyltransferase domain-containing protein [Fragilaria crotonensis]
MWPRSLVIRTSLQWCRRSVSSFESSTHAFDRDVKLLQRDGAARAQHAWKEDENAVDYDYFRQEIGRRLVDRLDDIKRDDGFPLALEVGAGPGILHRLICSDEAFDGVGGIGGIRKLVQLDSSSIMLHRDENVQVDGIERCGTYRMAKDEEENMPFPDGTFDLVVSSVALHWINELPKLFSEIKRVLKPDGCFIFAMIGGTTLPELRTSMMLAEMEREGGYSPHVGPFVELSDVGGLISGAGFNLPTIDVDTIKLAYPDAMVLMEHLQRMGESNACINRRPRTAAETFLATACLYDEMFKLETDDGFDDGSIEASVQVIYAIGWSPHESQQRPSSRGSATHKVGDIVERTKADKS